MLVLHCLPGRIRAKDKLLYDKNRSQSLGTYCENLYGVTFSRVNHHSATVLIVYDEEKTNRDLLLKNIEAAIHMPPDSGLPEQKQDDAYLTAIHNRNKAKNKLLLFGAIYLAIKVKQALYGKFSFSSSVRVLEVAAIVTIIGGYPLLKGLYRRFARHVPADADLLLSLTALSLTILRESTKGVLVLWLKELSDYIKYSAEAECMRLLRRNMGKTSGMAYLLKENEPVLVPVPELRPGETIVIHPGEVVSVNGEVVKGKALVNSLYHTGQPLVSVITDGHQVFEGMAVLSGVLTVRVTELPASYGKTDLSASDLRLSKNNRFYARNITYAALGAAFVYYAIRRSFLGALAILLALSPSASGAGFSSGMKNYVSMLNKNKIYIRNPNVFEKIVDIDHVVFDKTGTLTCGTMKIRGIEVLDSSYMESELLQICAACEVNDFHPISVTLQKAGEGYDIRKVQSSVLLPSKGICARYDGRDVLIGNKGLMEESDIDLSGGLESYDAAEKNLCTPVFVAIDHVLAGIIILEDVLRDDAKELIDELKGLGIRSITLLTGDGAEKARQAASALGIENVYSNCSAEDKVKIISRLKENDRVMMVGDGVNDVLSMREADVSVSYVDSACDKVKLHSDCIIFAEDLTKLPELILLSQKSYRDIRQNIFATDVYNLFFGFLAFSERIDAFAAKSFNTINSLMALLLMQRILSLSPGKTKEEQKPAEKQEPGTETQIKALPASC